MKYSASIEDGEPMTARDEKLMAPHKSSGEDSARVDQASAARADSSPATRVDVRVTATPLFTSRFQTNQATVVIVPCP